MEQVIPAGAEQILPLAGPAILWVTGDGGRLALASGLGGVTRWLMMERRQRRDGALSLLGGVIAGHYLWPMVIWTLGLERTPDTTAMAAFVAGTMGISGVRLIATVFETRARALTGGPRHG